VSTPSILPTQIGRYRILKKLGEGGMGAVYLAEDPELSRRVALKVPHFRDDDASETLVRFQREARVAAAIEHPNICRIYDVGQSEGTYYFTMEFVDGTPLSRLIQPDKHWPVAKALTMIAKLARALEVMHQRGIIHRDLKPSNVMIRPSGEPVLMDFGLARSKDQRLTASGSVMGTPSYMSTEQILGNQADLGPATDVYSLGVLLYEVLTGSLPFVGPLAAVYGQILYGTPAPPSQHRPDLDAEIDALCLKALSKKAEERYVSMADFAQRIEDYLDRDRSPSTLSLPPSGPGLGPTQESSRSQARLAGTPSQETRSYAPSTVPNVLPQEICNSIGMKLVLLPAGKLKMGSPESEAGRGADEFLHEVELSHPFYTGVSEVTQAQYERVMGGNPSHFTRKNGGGPDHPVENVTWYEAREFCVKLTELESGQGEPQLYRLPTEAEWEYACRGCPAEATPLPSGPSKASKRPPLWKTTPVAWFNEPNAFGLFDMLGNVFEWCADWYDKDYYRKSPRKDPQGPSQGTRRVLRGGSWVYFGKSCRPTCRGRSHPNSRGVFVGFRVVCVVGAS
jgi:serine/threonine protein kinase